MEKLKIVINGNEYIANKAKEFFSELGYHISAHNRNNAYGWSLGDGVGDYYGNKKSFDVDLAREVNLQQLHDMVVLKRNDVNDATHVDQYGDKWVCIGESWHFYSAEQKWDYSCKDLMSRYELKAIQKEKTMKEYLDPDNEYALILADDDTKSDQWIEVPEGAAVYGRNKLSGMREFYRNGKSIHIDRWSNGKWIESDYHVGNIDNIWCRKMQDKLDELKSSQKEKPQEKCADICGDVGENDVQSTLAERELQYGSFSDVAELTCDLMGDLVRPDMSFVQREALHMICSKLARIRCGDIDKIDSWHDIAGYATLVVQDLEKKAIDADKINQSDNRDWVEEIESSKD